MATTIYVYCVCMFMVLCVALCVPFFSMASTRFTRVWGAVSGGVNCSVKSRRETAETTTQTMVIFSGKTLKIRFQKASIDRALHYRTIACPLKCECMCFSFHICSRKTTYPINSSWRQPKTLLSRLQRLSPLYITFTLSKNRNNPRQAMYH